MSPCQVFQCNIYTPPLLGWAHSILCYITFAIILLRSPWESRNLFFLACVLVDFILVRCAMWNQHALHLTLRECFDCGTATCRLCIVGCSASSLCLCVSHFSLLCLPCFRHLSRSRLLRRLQRDLQGNCCFVSFIPAPPSSPSPTLLRAALLVVIQHSVKTLLLSLFFFFFFFAFSVVQISKGCC